MNRQEQSWLAWTLLALMFVSSLPYLIAWAATPAGARFTGFVFNPIDGHSYLAKMRQGFRGSWRFQLAFTPERSPGAPIFLFHLWLGHLARWAGLPLIAVYHGARILGGLAMLTSIYVLSSGLSDQRQERGTMFLLTAMGSGLGWLMLTTGVRTADLWVPEAFPIYALMTNAHFPVAIGLMGGIAYCGLRALALELGTDRTGSTIWPWGLTMTLAAMLLGAIQPFGLVPVFGGLGCMIAARTAADCRNCRNTLRWRTGTWIAVAAALALPYPLYMQMAIRSDPLLAQWNAQNVTPSPPLWDWALSYGPIIVLAAWGTGVILRRGSSGDFVLLGWALVTFVGMYVPLPLQRRLSIGLGVPIGLLAGKGWWRGARRLIVPRARILVRGLIIGFSILTPVFLIATVSSAALGPQASSADSWLYLSEGEWTALRWLRDQAQAQAEAVVLCGPQMGSFVPAWTGQRVVYGHPFETVNADRQLEKVRAYWSGRMDASDQAAFLRENHVQYVLVGPRERAINADERERVNAGTLVFETYDTQIYEVSGE